MTAALGDPGSSLDEGRDEGRDKTWLERALALDAAGQTAAAQTLARDALALSPCDPQALSFLATLALRAGTVEEARDLAARALAAAPQSIDLITLLAVCDQASGRMNDAAQGYLRLLAIAPGHTLAAANLGGLLLDAGQAENALPFLDVAVTGLPDDPGPAYNRAQALLALGRPAQALGDLERLGRLAPQFAAGWTARARAHRALGQLDAALDALSRVTALAPDDAGAHFNRAQLLEQMGRLDEAAQAIARAIELNAQDPGHHHLQAIILGRMGRLAGAEVASQTGLSLLGETATAPAAADRRRVADMWAQLGLILAYQRKQDDARTVLSAALHLYPDHPGALDTLTIVDRQAGKLDAALAGHDRLLAALAASGGTATAEMHNNRGCTLLDAKRPADAAEAFRAAIALDRDYAEALSNLGNALRDLNRPEEALACYQAALARRGDVAELHCNRGNVLRDLGRGEEAVAAYRQSVACNPLFVGGWINLALCLRESGALEGAEDAIRTALANGQAEPAATLAQAWMVLGTILHDAGRLEEAIEANERSLALRPDGVEAAWNLSLLLLLTGHPARGWPLYEARRRGRNAPRRAFAQPDWDGAPFPGQTLYIHIEQGIGDTLMAARYLPLAARLGGRVLVETPPEVAAVFADLPGRCPQGTLELVASDAATPAFDLHLPIMSLPGRFRAGLEPIPAEVPYLSAPTATVALWRQRLAALTQGDRRPRIGLVWAGNTSFTGDRWRSPRLGAFAPVLDVPGVRFFGLQMGDGRRDLEHAHLPADFVDLGAQIRDFGDTAAILGELDLLISSCTSPVHMAGALGRPVWVVLPAVPDWRWGMSGRDSAWYPSARLYRQAARGDWSAVMADVARDLAALASGEHDHP